MGNRPPEPLSDLWDRHSEQWRHPAQVVSLWSEAETVDSRALKSRARGLWWDTLAGLGITLLVTREYEHLVVALSAADDRPLVSFLPIPHPSGLVADRQTGTVHLASTRNPNQVLSLRPAEETLQRTDRVGPSKPDRTLVPVQSRFYPGALYMHDLAVIGAELYANAVGQNAVVRLNASGGFEHAWWPNSIVGPNGPRFDANHLQVNSIAAGEDLSHSFFTASARNIGRLRPGHPDFPVDGLGVVFAGATGEVVAGGLTRPHSARLHDGELWVDNSGYGQLGRVADGRFEPVWTLPGWTRGLCFVNGVAFVGTSRVIPRYRQYAPGLDVDRSVCAIHALDVASGKVLGSLTWPSGNQIFAIDWLHVDTARCFPFRRAGRPATKAETNFFYTFYPTPSHTGRNQKDKEWRATSGS